MTHLTWLVVALPAAGAAILLLGGRRTDPWGHLLGCATALASFGVGVTLLTDLLGRHGDARTIRQNLFSWVSVGNLHVDFGLQIDQLSICFVLLITGVGSLIHIYSVGYMAGDPERRRFFAFLNLFLAAMLLLVVADNYLVLYAGWEGVGLASYLLIGFWYYKPTAATAAKKAFVMNRVGDAGLALAMFVIFANFGTLSFAGVFAAAPGASRGALAAMGLLMLLGVCAKSAQVPLQAWLGDAMEGPTPVSALIHAATMVTAGVFMVCRLSPMFETSPTALHVVTIVGAATCFFAATIGTTQNDIKRVIAYSTCSQLGYMFFAAGVGAYGAAMFHLFTHAFFKALLFLGAGSVIHAMHHEQDMRYYGGLRKHIPITFWAMLLGTLAITGVGIYGVGGFAGYHSKDAIIEASWAAGAPGAFWAGVIAALLTSFYSWRLMFLTFWGKPRWAQSEHIQHAVHDAHGHDHAHDHAHDAHHDDHHAHDHGDGTAGYHPHESPLNMLVPLIVLSTGAVLAGFVFHGWFIDPTAGENFWRGSVAFNEHLMHEMHGVPIWVKLAATIVMLLGFAGAVLAYLVRTDIPARFTATFEVLYDFVYNKWYFDELYNLLFVRPAFAIGRFLWHKGDEGTIDRFGPNGWAWVVQQGSRVTARVQTGYVYTYAFVMLIGLTAAVTWVIAG
ncbi:MAG: NADH-quinone oxidoreductase subunit L [Sphingomonas sp.]|nr:NADH-quinone oxidoreductase subunit L [Sphingomonas sp.]